MAPTVGSSMMCVWVAEAGPWQVMQSFGPSGLVGEPICNGSRTHRGIDLGVGRGHHTILPASYSNLQVDTKSVATSGGYGNLIIVRNVPNGDQKYDVYMAHHDSLLVSSGSTVKGGTPLGITGSTGFSTGPHLHFEVRPAGSNNTCQSIDPTFLSTGSDTPTLTNVQLLNGGLEIPGLGDLQAATTHVENWATSVATGGLGVLLMGGGAVAMAFAMRGTDVTALARQVGQQANRRVNDVRKNAPQAPPTPQGRVWTTAEREWLRRARNRSV